MNNLVDTLGTLLGQHPSWGYLIVGIGILLQGELTLLLSVYLVINRFLSWNEFIATALGALFVGETLVYLIGRTLRVTRFGWRFYRRLKPNRRIQLYSYYLKKNIGKLFLIVRFLPTMNFAMLLLTGWSRVRFATFFKNYLWTVLLWFISMTGIAYFLMTGLSYLKTQRIFRNVEVGIVVILILVFLGEHFLRRALGRAIGFEERLNDNIEETDVSMDENASPEVGTPTKPPAFPPRPPLK